MLFTFATAG